MEDRIEFENRIARKINELLEVEAMRFLGTEEEFAEWTSGVLRQMSRTIYTTFRKER